VNALPVICAVASLPVGWFAGALLDCYPADDDSAEDVITNRQVLPLRPLPGVRLRGAYLALQLVMLVGFVGMGVRFESAPVLVIVGYLVLTAMLVTVSAIDIQCYRLPDRIVLPSLAVSVVLVVVESLRAGASSRIEYAATGALVYFGFLLVVHLISPNGMGFGDVKLAAVMGLYAGWLATDYTGVVVLVLWCMIVGFVAGLIIGLVLFVRRGRSRHIPFGPFLSLGCIVVVFWASRLTSVVLAV
jgi:leader peptidase (prepilin peptidase)/N-methyltransferase